MPAKTLGSIFDRNLVYHTGQPRVDSVRYQEEVQKVQGTKDNLELH